MADEAGPVRLWWRRWGLRVGVGLLVVFAIGMGALWWFTPELLYGHLDEADQAAAAATTRTGILAVVAATIAAIGAILALTETRRANREAHERDLQAQAQEREAQVTERYTRAVDQLGSTAEDVRLGGIYALGRIAEDSARDLPTVVEVLCAFVREHGQGPDDDTDEALAEHRPPPDVQAALTVIGRVQNTHAGSRVYLAGAHLERANLRGAYLRGAYLRGASLRGASLRGANLTHSDLRFAELGGAYLRGAILSSANLRGAILSSANLRDAILSGADLTGVRDQSSQNRLNDAVGNERTVLPKGLTRPKHWTPAADQDSAPGNSAGETA